MNNNTPKLHELALACYNGACNVCGIVNGLAGAVEELTPGTARDSVDLKIILGQLSFLVGESLGPSDGALVDFRKAVGGGNFAGVDQVAENASVDR